QAYLFFPMLLLEAISLHVSSIKAVTSRASRHGPAETVLLAIHVVSYLGIVFLVLSPVKAVVFIVVQQGLFGVYLGCSFAPNHKGMAILEAGDKTDFLRRQVLTSRNVRGGWLTDFVFGGLNYQIEHHLFPSMPRPNLRRSQKLVAAFCRQQQVPYVESSVIGSYVQALSYLHAVGRSGAAAAAGATQPRARRGGLLSSFRWLLGDGGWFPAGQQPARHCGARRHPDDDHSEVGDRDVGEVDGPGRGDAAVQPGQAAEIGQRGA
ncbi:MAG: acyl-CoA desaturase, partial [Actinomycetota bacterium]